MDDYYWIFKTLMKGHIIRSAPPEKRIGILR